MTNEDEKKTLHDMKNALFALYQQYHTDREGYVQAIGELADIKKMPPPVKNKFVKFATDVFDQTKANPKTKSWELHEFCDDCKGCRPAILDLQTNEAMHDDSPVMQAVNEMWDNETTYAERRAYIQVTLHSSRNQVDMERATTVIDKIKKVLEEKLK